MSTLYATQNGSWNDIQDIIKTATDWQANDIVLVGTSNIGSLAERLHARWYEFEIPMRVVLNSGETLDPSELEKPPFTGITTLPMEVETQIGVTGAVVFNEVLGTFKPVQKSPAL